MVQRERCMEIETHYTKGGGDVNFVWFAFQ